MTDLGTLLAGLRAMQPAAIPVPDQLHTPAPSAEPATNDAQKEEPAEKPTPHAEGEVRTAELQDTVIRHIPTFEPPPAAPTLDEREERQAADRIAAEVALEPQAIVHTALPEGTTASVTIRIPAPRPHQRTVLNHPARFKAWRAGRRVGKSRAELIAAVRGHGPVDPLTGQRKFKGMAQGGDIAWIAPDFPQSDTIWEEEILPRFYGRAGVTVSEKHRLIGFGKQLGEDAGGEPVYRGSLRIRSAENINSVRGKEFDGIIAEEAAFWKFLVAWRRVLRPTLINRRGWAIIASSTDIGSDFNQLMQEVEANKRGPNWEAFHHRTRDIPYIDEEEKADLAHDYPPGSAEELQELDAELLESLGTLFRAEFFHTYDAISRQAVWINGLRYEFEFLVAAVDVAASLKEKADYTAITIVGVCYPIDGIRRVAVIEIINEHLEGPEQIEAMKDAALQYRPGFIDIEAIGYQLTAVQHLRSQLKGRGLTVNSIVLKGDKRQKAVPAAAAMSRSEWFWPKEAPWLADAHAQLLKFPNGRAGSKLVADHDDIVDTLSLIAARVGGRTNSTWKMRRIRNR